MNLKAVAQKAGVSLATASRVLSGSTYPVRDDLRQRVIEAAEELDYVPNAQAQGLLHGNPNTIGVLVGDTGDPFFSGIIAGIHQAATERRAMVTISNTRRDPQLELDAFRTLQGQRCGVVILAGSGYDDEDYQAKMEQRIRSFGRDGRATILIGRHELDVQAGRVLADNAEAGRLMGKHLADLGHRKIGILTGDPHISSTKDRVSGIMGVLPEAVALPVDPTRDGGYAGAQQLLAEHDDITAIAGTADQMAMGAMAYLREQGITVPQEMSVIGCNDIWPSRDLNPPMTSVRLPLEEMGAEAVKLSARTGDISNVDIELPVELIVRESTGPARS